MVTDDSVVEGTLASTLADVAWADVAWADVAWADVAWMAEAVNVHPRIDVPEFPTAA